MQNNPQKPPSQELIMRMSQRINRSQHNSDKANSQYEQSQRPENQNATNDPQYQQQNDGGDDKESPIVALEPEDNYRQNGSNFMGTKKMMTQDGTSGGPQPSLYIQEKIYLKQREQEHILKSEEYHVVKTKDFNVIGRLRQEKPFVKAIVKSQAQSELNEKFITTECIADRRVKISSMAPRQYINAPSIEDVRKQGQHQMILSAINKKQTFAELINQANSMVTSVLHDPLKRSLNVLPSSLRYGIVQAGEAVYELIITCKNEDSIAQRFTIKPFTDRRIRFQQLDTGALAPGMIRKITVTVQSNEECTIKDTLQLITKTDIFKIPLEAQFLSPENYQREMQEQRALSGKTLANSRVRNKLNDSIQKGRISQRGDRIGGASIDGASEMDYIGGGHGNDWIQTTNSESKLPIIPQVNSRPFEVDPKKNLKDLLKK
ncbi:UNKNOWN [Stylonychia lemnae]|uniref:Uncharacterized protein n=1 Tax=Stylonychia lemnae TaxID=5949 RepID=A0A077ZRE7_STYLE|nr:UNKNOWN [Stylonychia lemnae]|eukprot:CDW72467.1 UNKNOWN [Stylonychia lemnae]